MCLIKVKTKTKQNKMVILNGGENKLFRKNK